MFNLKWIIAHEPLYLFERTAKAFANMIKENSNGEITIEILTKEDYRAKYDPDFFEMRDLFDHISTGKIDIGHTHTFRFGGVDNNFRVFDMPYLFEDHEHASRVVDGPIGMSMAKRLAKNSNMRGLAYTYSGGFRIVGSNEEFTTLEDLQGKRIRINGNPVSNDYWKALGLEPVRTLSDGMEWLEQGKVEAADTTAIRFIGNNVLKSNHSMFLTLIVINEDTWNSMPEYLQKVMADTSLEVAKLERQWSIEDAAKLETDLTEKNMKFVEISNEETAKFRDATKEVYDIWTNRFTPGLVDAIKAEATKH